MIVIKFMVNGQLKFLDIDFLIFLLWILCDYLSMMGIKFGCGVGMCGVCIVYFNGVVVCFCQILVQVVFDVEIIMIEGLLEFGDYILQMLWVEFNVFQCGYCQVGVLMVAAELLKCILDFIDEEIDV